MLTPETLPALQEVLRELDLDGWLLFDFQSSNPIAVGVLGLAGMLTRRHLAYVPREGVPVAIPHRIEPAAWRSWPAAWAMEPYADWRELEAAVARVVGGKRIALEYSPGNAVPYLDRVPAGVVEMVRAAGGEVVSSAALVSRYYAAWSPAHLASHERAAERVARIARGAIVLAGARASTGQPIAEHELRQWTVDALDRAGLVFDHPPIIAAGANAANVHHEATADAVRRIERDDVLLVDVWGREPDGVYADQTWMGVLGPPSTRTVDIWETIRAARDAAVRLLRTRIAASEPVRGLDVHEAANAVVRERGYGAFAVGRTGHSIDTRELHGAGPNVDGVETRDDRMLVPGLAFSIEPGIYIPGEVGMRTEVNVYFGEDDVIVTPREYQVELIVV